MFGAILDGVTYNLRVTYETLRRSFRIADGDNAGNMLSGYYQRDVIGTYYDYEMTVEADPNDPATYDNFYEAITAPVDSHEITLPYGQGTITFHAMVTEGEDYYRGTVGRKKRWGSLRVLFTAIEVKREPE